MRYPVERLQKEVMGDRRDPNRAAQTQPPGDGALLLRRVGITFVNSGYLNRCAMKLILLTTLACCWTILVLGQSKQPPEIWLEKFFREQKYAVPSVLQDNSLNHFKYGFKHQPAHDSLVMLDTTVTYYTKTKEEDTYIHELAVSWRDIEAWHFDKVYGTRIVFTLFRDRKYRQRLLQQRQNTEWIGNKEFETPAILPNVDRELFKANMAELVKENIAWRKGSND